MKGHIENDNGSITIDLEAVAQYAGSEAMECFGIVGMATVSMKDGLVRLLKKDSLARGINVSLSEDNRLTIDFHVIVAYGVSIQAVAANLMDAVKYRLEKYTGFEVEKINIFVDGVKTID